MAYTPTTWQDRVVQYPNRYAKTGETTTEVTLTLSAGTVTTAGTAVNATNLNKIETGISNAHTDIATANSNIATANTNIASNILEINNHYVLLAMGGF